MFDRRIDADSVKFRDENNFAISSLSIDYIARSLALVSHEGGSSASPFGKGTRERYERERERKRERERERERVNKREGYKCVEVITHLIMQASTTLGKCTGTLTNTQPKRKEKSEESHCERTSANVTSLCHTDQITTHRNLVHVILCRRSVLTGTV